MPATVSPLSEVTYPARSPVHRRGIFASRELLPGESFEVGVTHGTLLHSRLIDGFGPCPIHGRCYLLCIGDRSHFINHDPVNPNVVFVTDPRSAVVTVRILHRIPQDTELFADYGSSFTAFHTSSRTDAS